MADKQLPAQQTWQNTTAAKYYQLKTAAEDRKRWNSLESTSLKRHFVKLFVAFMSHTLHDTLPMMSPPHDLPAVGIQQLAGRHVERRAVPKVPPILYVAPLEEVGLEQDLVPHDCLTLQVDLYHWEGVYRLHLQGLRRDRTVVVDGGHPHGVSRTRRELWLNCSGWWRSPSRCV